MRQYWESPRAKRDDATRTYLASCQEGRPLTGKELAIEFGMSDSWGRDIVRQAKRSNPAPAAPVEPQPEPVEPPSDSDCQVADSAEVPAEVDETSEAVTDWVGNVLSLFVALVAFVVSYGHLYDVALASGENEHLAKLYPLCIDVLAIAAYRAGPRGRRWMIFAVALSVLGNVGSRFPQHVGAVGPAVAVVPVVVAFGAHCLISKREES